MSADTFPKDITEATITGIDVQPVTNDPGSATTQPTTDAGGISIPPPAPAEQDHAGIALLDIAIQESVKYCEREGFPAPNTALWDNFSRGFLNKALWHYFPTGAAPESPAVCALIGIGGLAVCYTPVILAFYEKKQKEEAAAKRKAAAAKTKPAEPEEEIEEEPEPQTTSTPPATTTHTKPAAAPDWVTTHAPAISAKAEPAGPGMS